MSIGYYLTAQVCLNGHVANKAMESDPHRNKAFCEKCGERTISKCPSCEKPIRGPYEVPVTFSMGLYEPPSFCLSCGSPFPWTTMRQETVLELLKQSGALTDDDLADLPGMLSDTIRDTPRATIGASRLQVMIKKAGPQVGSIIRDLLVNIVSESAKKLIWPS